MKFLLIFFISCVSLSAKDVNVKFQLVIPDITPDKDTVFIQGSFNNWDPGTASPPDSSDFPLSYNSQTGYWEISIDLKDRTTVSYLYTRGSVETVENNPDSTARASRNIFVDSELVPFIVKDTVLSWTDFTLPPTPENGAPALTFFNNQPQTSIAIAWGTEAFAESKVYYGINDVNENAVIVTEHSGMIKNNDSLIHRVRITELSPNTTYKYKVVTEGVYESDELSFTTADYSNEFMFIVMGDNRPGVSFGVLNGTLADKPKFVLHTGDLVQQGLVLSDWFVFFRNWDKMIGTIPTMPIYGNHEQFVLLNEFFVLPDNEAPKPENVGQWYSFDYNNIHIVGLYSYDDFTPGSDQHNWLINDLENIGANIEHVFVQIHEPPFTSGILHGPNFEVREHLVPVFEKYKVDIVFYGHEHFYERSIVNGITHITTGGAGSPLYFINGGSNEYSIIAERVFHYVKVFVDGKNLKVDMVRYDGTIGDQFKIIKGVIEEIPTTSNLLQNYPNPFNEETIINFSLSESSNITLSLFNILGEKVSDLENGFKEAGFYEVKLNAGKFASGVYFYRFKSDHFEETRKLVLIK